MTILAYFLSLGAFYVVYLLSSILLAFPIGYIHRLLSKEPIKLDGFNLLLRALLSTYLSLISILVVFQLFQIAPNWIILIPVSILFWFYFTPTLYRPHFYSGAAHWGMASAIGMFLGQFVL